LAWSEDVSMRSLFGPLGSGDEFSHDRKRPSVPQSGMRHNTILGNIPDLRCPT
jgi:hypothetical protein